MVRPRQENLNAAYLQFEIYAVNRVRQLVQMHGVDNMRSAFTVFEAIIDLAILNLIFPTNETPNGDFYENYIHISSNVKH
jgi:hypothetical protein